MRENVGGNERIARLIVGSLLVVAGLRWLGGRWTRRPALAAGGELLTTALVGWCPANAALGRNSADQRDDRSDERRDVPV